MQSREVTVRMQSLGGHWDTAGVDQARGIYPENVVAVENMWGPDQASFNLKRDPGVTWPDLAAFTPVEIEIGGGVVWSGRVKETPTKQAAERVINVQCEGWQYHLDDDSYERVYVHANLGDWRDCRGFLGENLALFTTAGQVTADAGSISLGWQNGAVLAAGVNVGVKLDMGPLNQASSLGIEVKGITGAANSDARLFVLGSPDESFATTGTNQPFVEKQLSVIGTGANVYEGDFPALCRYITIGLYVPSGVTLNGDVMLQVRAVTTTTSSTFINPASTTSTLLASQVVNDAISLATSLFSADRTGIQGTSFFIPSFTMTEPRTPREVIQSVNAYHDWVAKIDSSLRMVYKPKASVATLEVGAWSAMEIDDASANSGEEIYSRVIVTGQTPAGQPIRVIRNAAAGTLPQRRGFTRTKALPVQSALPGDGVAAAQIGDTWLTGHKLTPFKGTITLLGQASVREIMSGAPVPLESLLNKCGELLRFTDRVDPDNGGVGRDGRITQVSYDFDKDQATVTVDNSRASFEALLSRLAVVTGGG